MRPLGWSRWAGRVMIGMLIMACTPALAQQVTLKLNKPQYATGDSPGTYTVTHAIAATYRLTNPLFAPKQGGRWEVRLYDRGHDYPLEQYIDLALALNTIVVEPVGASPSVLQSPPRCVTELEQRMRELNGLIAQLEGNQLTNQTVQQLVRFVGAFRANVQEFDLYNTVKSGVIGGGSSVAGNLIAAGTATVATASLPATVIGVVIGIAVSEAVRRMENVGTSWQTADENTAMYIWLLDHVEFNRAAPMNANIETFVAAHGDVMRSVTGVAPPGRGAALAQYLGQHAGELLYFLGQLEEYAGATRFPRWKFPRAAGRYGPERQDIGYYRQVMAGKIREELGRLRAEMVVLRNAATCRTASSTEAPGTINWHTFPGDHRGDHGRRYVYECPANPVRLHSTVWGSNPYTDDSSICAAAVHAGAITFDRGGRVVIEIVPGQDGYPATERNSVSTAGWGSWGGSFRVVP